MSSAVSGVGYNVAKALVTVADWVRLLSIWGRDSAGTLARNPCGRLGFLRISSHKIGEIGAAAGFLDADALQDLCKELQAAWMID